MRTLDAFSESRLLHYYIIYNDYMLFKFLLFIILVGVVAYLCYTEFRNKKFAKQPLRNFPFIYRGREFWYSRACAVTSFVFCQNKEGKWCVLANKRGSGTPDFQGYWNCPCGYLDFNEDGEGAAIRETFEECGIKIDRSEIHFVGVNSLPTQNKQNVSLRYVTMINGIAENFDLNDKASEKNEVKEIKWIPLDEIENYKWAFGHDELVDEMYAYGEKL